MGIRLEEFREFLKQNTRWFFLVILLVAFAIITQAVLQQEILQIDEIIYKWVHQVFNHDIFYNFFLFITDFGSASVLIIICLLSFFLAKKRRYGMSITINLLVIFILNIILKNIFQRPRPENLMLITETGFSFPSGHSMVSMAFYGYLIYLAYKKIYNIPARNTTCILLSLLIILIGISRIYLGVHYASDVLGGFCLGAAYLIIYIKISNSIIKWRVS